MSLLPDGVAVTDVLTAPQILAAQEAGYAAAASGATAADCPWRGDATPEGRASAQQWICGLAAGRTDRHAPTG